VNSAAEEKKEAKETGRTEAFSDGVFAIAITLLVLELKVPHLPGGGTVSSLARALADEWPSYTSFVISFFTILIMWANHHAMFNMVCRIDVPFLYANGFLLLMVTFIPFPTSVLATYLETPAAPMAGAFFAGTYVLLGVAFNLLWAAARYRGLLRPDIPEAKIRTLTGKYRLGMPLYLIATVASFVSVYLAVGICAALAIFWVVVGRLD
jgi:uncharacterized membrane protein